MVKMTDRCVVCGEYMTEGEGFVCRTCQKDEGICLAFKNIHIENSYNTWLTTVMWAKITVSSWEQYKDMNADRVLNRSYRGMYFEWYLHNIGYWLTRPFIKIKTLQAINERCKHVDLEEHKQKYIA